MGLREPDAGSEHDLNRGEFRAHPDPGTSLTHPWCCFRVGQGAAVTRIHCAGIQLRPAPHSITHIIQEIELSWFIFT